MYSHSYSQQGTLLVLMTLYSHWKSSIRTHDIVFKLYICSHTPDIVLTPQILYSYSWVTLPIHPCFARIITSITIHELSIWCRKCPICIFEQKTHCYVPNEYSWPSLNKLIKFYLVSFVLISDIPLWAGVDPLSSFSLIFTTPCSISIRRWLRSPLAAAMWAGKARSDL